MPSIPLAVEPSVKTPGLYITVNLLGALANAGALVHRALIIAPKGSAGNIAVGTEVRQVFGPDDVATSHGPGTQAHLAAKKYFLRNPNGPVDVVAPTASAGVVATATQTFTGPATQNSVIRFRAHGRVIDVAWNNGEAATTFVTRAVAAINAEGADLAFVASDAGSGSILSTAKVAGLWANDILINASVLSGGGGIAVSVNPTNLSAGTLEPSFATVLSLVATRKYRRIVGCYSNTDASSASATSNPGRVATHIDSLETGNEAKLQVGVVGHTGTIANAKAGAIAKNNEAMQYVFGQTFEDLPCELAGAEAGDALRFVTARANYNRIGNRLSLLGPQDAVGEKPTAAEVEDLLNNGVTPLNIEQLTGEIFVVRPITTHSLSGSSPDYRAFDMSDTDGMYSVVEDLQIALPQEFANCSITEDLPPGVNRLPPGVVERKDVFAFIVNRLGKQVDLGVVDANRLEQSISTGELIVEINGTDETQVDIFLPAKIVKPLAKFGLSASKVA
jgi:phage tail sheath gpL-like